MMSRYDGKQMKARGRFLSDQKRNIEIGNERIFVVDLEFDFLAELSPARLRLEMCFTQHYHVSFVRS